jgi:hypothetical protein
MLIHPREKKEKEEEGENDVSDKGEKIIPTATAEGKHRCVMSARCTYSLVVINISGETTELTYVYARACS